MQKCLFCLSFLFITNNLFGQASLSPVNATASQLVNLTFDATNTPLASETTIYAHAGVVTKNTTTPTGTDWTHVKGNWGKDDGIGKMTAISGQPNKWQLTFSPTLQEYFGVDQSTTVYWLAVVFRNAAGTKQTSPDIFIKLNIPDNITIVTPDPANTQLFIEPGQSISISTITSTGANKIEIFADAGSGYQSLGSVANATTFQTNFSPSQAGTLSIKAVATFSASSAQTSAIYSVSFRGATVMEDLPAGIQDGINYSSTDATKATLVLLAPNKQFVYAVGDFNNWQIDNSYLMKKTSDGERFWIELNGLEQGKEYIFQYWVDGTVKIGDPLADKVSDPYNDASIPSTTYPNLPPNSRVENGVATILQTGQVPFPWSSNEATYLPPAKDELLIYELLLRDFIGSRRYKDLADSLNYFKRLGINTIELMPIMEFEGNLSWGYNPSYFLAPDKMYGTKNDLKNFIDRAHQMGIAVVLDIALNHAFSQNAMVKMYWDKTNNKPAVDNPWFNTDATHPYNVGYDFNHESLYTKAFVDTVTSYWLTEYHVDGFRFDLSKGFTQKNTGNDVGTWSAYDASRINILDRMASHIFSVHPKAIVILEHFADEAEEANLASKGMILWRNLNYDFREVLKGNTVQSFGNALARTHVSYMESHDEERMAFDMLANGRESDNYKIKNVPTVLDRMKMAAAFLYTLPGSKMMWQFQELGYDKSINTCSNGALNENCRLDNKPLVWGSGSLNYYDDAERQKLFETFSSINKLVNTNKDVFKNGSTTWKSSGDTRRINITHPAMDVTIVGNFATVTSTVQPNFSKSGTWFEYFSGESIHVADPNATLPLTPGEFHIFTTVKQPTPKSGLVTGVEDEKDPASFLVYPNPAKGKIYISMGEENKEPFTISIIDLLGRKIDQYIFKNEGQPMEMDISPYQKGIYIIKLRSPNNRTKIQKLIIED